MNNEFYVDSIKIESGMVLFTNKDKDLENCWIVFPGEFGKLCVIRYNHMDWNYLSDSKILDEVVSIRKWVSFDKIQLGPWIWSKYPVEISKSNIAGVFKVSEDQVNNIPRNEIAKKFNVPEKSLNIVEMNKFTLFKIKSLQEGNIIISKEAGNSMLPIIKSKEPVILVPKQLLKEPIKKDDIVYAKIHGTLYTHKVYGVKDDGSVLIGNNKGHLNGWTNQVYGKAYLIPKEEQKDLNSYLEKFKNDYSKK